MSGTILFRPVEANLTHDTNWLGKMDPYCKFSIGANHAQSSVCRHGGTRPHWGDTVSLNTTGLATGVANVVRLEIFDKDKFRPDDHIAYTDIDLAELLQLGSVSKWYPLYHRRKPAGEILIEAAIQQQQTFVQQTVVPTTYVQETVISTPLQGVVGESYVVSENVLQTGLPLNQNLGLVGSTNLGSYTVEPNVYTTSSVVTNPGLVASNPVVTDPHLVSKTSLLGPAGGIPHGFHKLKGMTNAGYSERPGYTLGDTEANPTCQSNLDSNGGGFFNKPGREKRAEPYSLSNPGTYGIPHGQTIDTAGHLRPDVTLERQAPIGTVNHPGITGYVDGYNVPQQGLYNSGLNSGVGTGLNQAGSYGTGLNTGLNQAGSYGTGLNTGLNQAGSYGTGLNTGLGTGLNQAGSYGTGLNTGLNQVGSYGTGLNTGLGQGSYVGGESNLVQGNLIGTLGQQNLGQYGQGLAQPGLNTQAGLSTQSGLVGQPGLTSQQGFAQTGVIDERGPTNTHYHGNTRL